MGRDARAATSTRRHRDGARPDDCQPAHLRRVEGEQTIVGEQHGAANRQLAGERPSVGIVLFALGHAVPAAVQHAGPLGEAKDPPRLLVEHRLVDVARLHRVGKVRTEPVAGPGHLDVEPGGGGADRAVRAEPVGYDDTVEAPFALEDLPEQPRMLTAERAVEAVIGAHHRPHARLRNRRFEWGEVDLAQRTIIDVDTDRHPFVLLVVAREVLDATPDPMRLHAVDVRDREPRGEPRVLGEGLERAASERCPWDADRWTEQEMDALRPCLGGERRTVSLDEIDVPRRTGRHAARERQGSLHADALATYAGRSIGHLQPPDAEPLDGREVPRVVTHRERGLLLPRELSEEFFNANVGHGRSVCPTGGARHASRSG